MKIVWCIYFIVKTKKIIKQAKYTNSRTLKMFLKCIGILIKLNFKPKFLIKGELRYIKASNILILFKKKVYLRTS